MAPDAGDSRRIRVEDLGNGSSFRFGANQGCVTSLFFDRASRTLLAGDEEGHLVEYGLDLQEGKGRAIERHGDLGIARVSSASCVAGLVFFGGKYGVRVFDLAGRRVLPGLIETAVKFIFSLQVCVLDSRVYLAVVGEATKYSSTQSDLCDVSGLVPLAGCLASDPKLLLTRRNPLRTRAQPRETLVERLARLEKQLAQKSRDHDALLARNEQLEKENRDLTKKNKALEKGKASLEETVSTLIEAKGGLDQRLCRAESRLQKYKDRLKETFDQKKSIRAKFEKMEKTSKARIGRLGLKLRILNMKAKSIGNPGDRREAQRQPDPAEVIRDLEHRLYVKANEWADMRNVVRHTLSENARIEKEIQERSVEVDSLKHQLMNTREANREG